MIDIDARTRASSGHYLGNKQARPLPWRWTVVIITVLSALAWIPILFGVITVLDHL